MIKISSDAADSVIMMKNVKTFSCDTSYRSQVLIHRFVLLTIYNFSGPYRFRFIVDL